jgi:glycosyltransferase involved in cell wall biosynthesis
MKIVHVNYYDIKGGAAKAAYRLHCSLLNAGHESIMLVAEKFSDDNSVRVAFSANELKWIHIKQRIESFICRLPRRTHDLAHALNLFNSRLPEYINSLKPDMVHLHWINGCMLSIKDIARINGPIAWTLHDNWVYCGAEHYHKLNNDAFKNSYCGIFSINNLTWRRKCKAWANMPFSIATPSRWIGKEANESVLLGEKNITVIPNGVDIDVFKPYNKTLIKQKLGIAENKLVVAFGAFAVNDKNKGGPELLTALNILYQKYKSQIEVLLIGHGEINLPFKIHSTGYISDDLEIAEFYSAADIFILPSKQDNLPNMIMEAMACGTPSVGFSTGGIPDMIDHKINGYLAEAFDCKDFANGIQRLLDSPEYDKICCNAREKVEDKFNINNIATQYIELYKQVLAIS